MCCAVQGLTLESSPIPTSLGLHLTLRLCGNGLGRSGRQPFERTPTHEGCAFWASDGDAWNAENRSELVCLVALLVEGMALRISAHPQQDTF